MELLELLKEPEISQLFFEVGKCNPQAKEELVKKLFDANIPSYICRGYVDKIVYELNKDDLRQDFLVKILEGKIRWNPQKGKLIVYIKKIISSMWTDILRKKAKAPREIQKYLFGVDKVLEIDGILDCSIELKTECRKEFDSLSCKMRLVIKLWIPYLFNYEFSEDEIYLLEQMGMNHYDLSKRLRLEIDEKMRNHGKIQISAEEIAKILSLSANNIHQIIYRVKKKLKWLKNLKNSVKKD